MKNAETVLSRVRSVDVLSKASVRTVLFGLASGVLVLLFWEHLLQLVRSSRKTQLYSHIPLLPFISAYLLWVERSKFSRLWDHRVPVAALFGALGLATLLYCQFDFSNNLTQSKTDLLSLRVLSFVSFISALSFFFLGKANFDIAAFPVGFLFLMVPLPAGGVNALTIFLQHASAHTAHIFFIATGTPVFRDGLAFVLPGLEIEVAEECSGIRSTLVLLITSLLAGYLFLRKPWGKWILAVAVVPIGILRNGIRIWTISWLTVNVDSGIIHSPVHHRGGPFFFVLSLVPLLALLAWLRKLERRPETAPGSDGDACERVLPAKKTL